MKILFCIYQIDYADHIALAYLSAVARELGHTTHLCCMQNDNLSDAVATLQPDVVAYSANIHGFQQMVRAHKQALQTRAFVSIMGGPQPTFSPETFAFSGVDAYCVGEGEAAFQDFLVCVENGVAFDGVPNLITAKAHNPVRPLIGNLDELPFPDRDLTLSNSFLRTAAKKTFYATRGCPYQCNYCCNNKYHDLYRGKGPAVRRFSAERLIREIEYVQSRYRTEFVKFGDDIFAIKADAWLEEFCAKYAERVAIPFNCYLRIDRVNEKVLALLKKAGCYSVHLSVDSSSTAVQERVLGRQMKAVDVVGQLKMVRRFGINTWVNFMLAAPHASLQDDLESIRIAKKGRVTYTAYSTTVPMVGTQLYDYCVQKKLIDPDSHKSDMTGCWEPSTLKCFSKKEKNRRYNIFLMGAIIAKLPAWLGFIAMGLIKHAPPNALFLALRNRFYKFSIENKIFKVSPQKR